MCIKEWTLSSVKVKATIVEDNTGIKSQLPILITEQGEVGSVTDYLLKMEADGASNALMNGLKSSFLMLWVLFFAEYISAGAILRIKCAGYCMHASSVDLRFHPKFH